MARTIQQQAAIDAVCLEGQQLVKIPAVAGAGKTFTLIELTKELNPDDGIYLAYNKAIAKEAAAKFKDTNVSCMTIHALALQGISNVYPIKVGNFGVRDVQPSSLPYAERLQVSSLIDAFCLSPHLSFDDYVDSLTTPVGSGMVKLVKHHLDLLADGSLSCSHNFYLKLYHIAVNNGTIEPPSTELLMLDEFGDITPVTLSIFMNIKATKKVATGDVHQNIYSFNNTINGFKVLDGTGVTMPLTQSFRVPPSVAKRIEHFMQHTADPDFEFKGTVHTDILSTKHAYISRSNAALVIKMFDLMYQGIAFNTTRPVSTILELPLILARLDPGKPITSPRYRAIDKLRHKWAQNKYAKRKFSTFKSYVQNEFRDDYEISSGFGVVAKYGSKLEELASYASKCKSKSNDVILSTAHSVKGLEFGSVTILDDLNDRAHEAIRKLRVTSLYLKGESSDDTIERKKQFEELRLYYVAASRAMHYLNNATCLDIKS